MVTAPKIRLTAVGKCYLAQLYSINNYRREIRRFIDN